MKLKTILLAAGFGTRLRPLTLKTPKCLVEINGTPLLGHWLKKLNKLGCNEVLINTHYMSEKVEKYVSEIHFNDMKISTTYENNLLGTAGTLLKNIHFYKDSVGLLIHADNFTNDPLNNFVDSHISKPKDCLLTMLTFKTDNPSSCGIVKKDKLGRIISFLEKPYQYHGNCANGALYAFDNDFLNYLTTLPDKINDFSTEIIPNLLGKIYSHNTDSVYLDIGNYEAYKRANIIAKDFQKIDLD